MSGLFLGFLSVVIIFTVFNMLHNLKHYDLDLSCLMYPQIKISLCIDIAPLQDSAIPGLL